MRRNALVVALAAGALLTAGWAQAQQDAPWLHIRVVEEGGARVSVNLPLSLIAVFADIAEQEIRTGRHLDIDEHDIEIADIRRAWNELRDAGDAEFVTVEKDDEFVRISRAGNMILIEMEDLDDADSARGRIEVPVSVVDALLSGEGQELNIHAALDELVRVSSGEIVFVENDDTTVRIWIE